MYEEIYEKVDGIVESIRKNTEELCIGINNALYPDVIEYKQPSMRKQLDLITDLVRKGVNIEVIDAPVGLAEFDGKDTTVTIENYRYGKESNIQIDEKYRTVFFYIWAEAINKEDGNFMGVARYTGYEDEYKLKDLSEAL